MTRGEAVYCLRDMMDGMPFDKCADWIDACLMAIKSLEAWDKVEQDIAEYLEEYDGVDANGNHNLKWCAMKEAEMLINKHLKEVKL